MTTANLGRIRRIDKNYSRARSRADLQRTIDEELDEELMFPLAQIEDDSDTTSIAQLMSDDPDDDG